MKDDQSLREHLLDLLGGGGAHAKFDDVVKGLPPKLRSTKPEKLPHTAWMLLEHLRIAQWDILEFSRDAKHVSPDWPAGHWPKTEAPPSAHAWDKRRLEGHAGSGRRSKDGSLRTDSLGRWSDDIKGGSAGRGPQRLPPGADGGFAEIAGRVERIVSLARRVIAVSWRLAVEDCYQYPCGSPCAGGGSWLRAACGRQLLLLPSSARQCPRTAIQFRD